jgi:hypothetical protein
MYKTVLADLAQKGMWETAENFCQTRKKQKNICFYILGQLALDRGDMKKAVAYFEKTEGVNRRKGIEAVADVFLSQSKFKEAASLYEQFDYVSSKKALVFYKLAGIFKKNDNIPLAKESVQKAVIEHERVIKSFDTKWKDIDFNNYRQSLEELKSLKGKTGTNEKATDLSKVLKKSATYCLALEKSAFEFFCNEIISEKINFGSYKTSTEKRYDYRVIKDKKGAITENRYLVEVNGVKTDRKVEDIDTQSFKLGKIIYGPSALFGEYWQAYFNYHLLRKEVIGGKKFYVIDVIPRMSNPLNTFFGTAWVSEDDGSIFKIDWNPKSIEGQYGNFQEEMKSLAKSKRGEPLVAFQTEFNYLYKGVRFPTKNVLNKFVVLNKNNKRVMISRQTVKYDNYYIFSVSTEVSY